MDKTWGYFSPTTPPPPPTTYHRTVHGAARALEAPHNGPIGALASSLRRKVSIFAELAPHLPSRAPGF